MAHPRVEAGATTSGASPAYVLLTDAPPLRRGGHGCHVLAWNWLEAMGDATRLVVTHQLSPRLRPAEIAADLRPIPVAFYPDGSAARLGRLLPLRILLDWLLFLLALPRLRRAVRASGAERIFALFGADAPFLLPAALLARATGLPLDVYLVDDLEASATANGRPRWWRWAVRGLERRTLRHRAARVYAISPGYVEHLRAKYGVAARWLPVSAAGNGEVGHVPFQPGTSGVRYLVFSGSINVLYLDALRDVCRAIAEFNRASPGFTLRLKLLVMQPPEALLADPDAAAHAEVILNAPADERERHLRAGWATLLPYSFAPEAGTLVRTSFSTKFTDSLASGRPIVVYGPADASLPRYFREAGLPLCATSPGELAGVLRAIAAEDTPALIARYAELGRRHHSGAALRAALAAGDDD